MDKKAKHLAASLILIIFFAAPSYSQKISLATNGLGYVNFLTINAEMGIALDRNWSVSVSGKYNPFTYNKGMDNQLQNKQLTVSAGARFWPFYVFSGFFYEAKMQYSRYNQGGIINKLTREGDALGLGINFGYSLLVTSWFNIEFGLGVWSGGEKFVKYACPRCGRIIDSGKKFFISPNDAMINMVFTF
jgi:hypothetical protein